MAPINLSEVYLFCDRYYCEDLQSCTCT